MELPGADAGRPARREPPVRRPRGGCRRLAALTDLTSAPVPPPTPDDHVRGPAGAPLAIVYADYECPYCAALHARLHALPVRLVFRHFPVRSKHPRAWAAACAAEAAALQGRFWQMHDALFADQGRLDDPHLWARAERLDLDVERFDADRRSDQVRARVDKDFRSGLRAGVTTTPAAFLEGELVAGPALLERLDADPGATMPRTD